MVSKLILLLGTAAAAFIAYLCIQQNQTQLEASAQSSTPTYEAPLSEAAEALPSASAQNATTETEESTPEVQLSEEREPDTATETERNGTAATAVSETAEERGMTEPQEQNVSPQQSGKEEASPSKEERTPEQAPALQEPAESPQEASTATEETLPETSAELQTTESTDSETVAPLSEEEVQNRTRSETGTVAVTEESLVDRQQAQIAQTQEEIDTLLREHPIYFRSNSSELTLDSKKLLNRIIDLVNRNTEEIERLRVAGHTDASGPANYNRRLSQKRAEAVRDYLVKHHIQVPTVEAIGYGEERPLTDNPYAKENRRVEITIVKGE